MNNKTPPNIITILSTTSENKIKALRKAKGFSPSRLAKQAKIDKEQLLVWESSRVELITSELSKIAKVLQVGDDLLLDGAAVLPSADLRQLNYIFMQQKQKADISLLQTQILNWAVVLLHNVRKEWENMRASSFAAIAQMDRKQKAIKGAQIRDNRYKEFREKFKEIQYKKFLEEKKKGNQLKATRFANWFLKQKNISIPYTESNQLHKLTQLAQANNREFNTYS